MVCKYCRYEGWEGDRCPQCGARAEEEFPLEIVRDTPSGDGIPADIPAEPKKEEGGRPVAPPPFIPPGTPGCSAPPPPQIPQQWGAPGGYPQGGVPQYVLFHPGSVSYETYNPWTAPRSPYGMGQPVYPAWRGGVPGGVPTVAPYRPGVPQYPYYMPPQKKPLAKWKIAAIAAGAVIGGALLMLAVGLLWQSAMPPQLPYLDSPYVETDARQGEQGPIPQLNLENGMIVLRNR